MANLLKAAKLGGVALIVGVIIFALLQVRVIIKDRDRARLELAEIAASAMPDTAKADTIIVYKDSAAVVERDKIIHKLQSRILKLARNQAETVLVETYVADTLGADVDGAACTKTIRGEYLYQSAGITAHISSMTDCNKESVTFTVGAYYKPDPVTWGFDRINLGWAYWDKPHFAVSVQFSTPWGFSIGPALIDNAVGINIGIKL